MEMQSLGIIQDELITQECANHIPGADNNALDNMFFVVDDDYAM